MDKPEAGDGKMIDNKQILTEKLSNSYSCENFRIQTTHVHALMITMENNPFTSSS